LCNKESDEDQFILTDWRVPSFLGRLIAKLPGKGDAAESRSSVVAATSRPTLTTLMEPGTGISVPPNAGEEAGNVI